jgi:hypothetical protein
MRSPYTRAMNSRRSYLALLLTCLLASACGGESTDGSSEEAPGDAKASGKAARELRSKRVKKDRGDASMVFEGTAWAADAAKASFRGDRLTIRASRMGRVEDVMVREELHLAIGEFKGPGAYTSTMSGSRFMRVGINTKSAAAAGSDDAEVSKEVTKALTGAKHQMLMGAKITITKVADGQVSGTFSWTSPTGSGQMITDGTFRALIRK